MRENKNEQYALTLCAKMKKEEIEKKKKFTKQELCVVCWNETEFKKIPLSINVSDMSKVLANCVASTGKKYMGGTAGNNPAY